MPQSINDTKVHQIDLLIKFNPYPKIPINRAAINEGVMFFITNPVRRFRGLEHIYNTICEFRHLF